MTQPACGFSAFWAFCARCDLPHYKYPPVVEVPAKFKTIQEVDSWLINFPWHQIFNPPGEGSNTLRDESGNVFVCWTYVRVLQSIFEDRLSCMGFWLKEVPEVLSEFPGDTFDGHDFCVLDGRWLLDPWRAFVLDAKSKRKGHLRGRICYDLKDKAHQEYVKDFYGSSKYWTPWELALEAPFKIDQYVKILKLS